MDNHLSYNLVTSQSQINIELNIKFKYRAVDGEVLNNDAQRSNVKEVFINPPAPFK